MYLFVVSLSSGLNLIWRSIWQLVPEVAPKKTWIEIIFIMLFDIKTMPLNFRDLNVQIKRLHGRKASLAENKTKFVCKTMYCTEKQQKTKQDTELVVGNWNMKLSFNWHMLTFSFTFHFVEFSWWKKNREERKKNYREHSCNEVTGSLKSDLFSKYWSGTGQNFLSS